MAVVLRLGSESGRPCPACVQLWFAELVTG
jgi:hypothetical protein